MLKTEIKTLRGPKLNYKYCLLDQQEYQLVSREKKSR